MTNPIPCPFCDELLAALKQLTQRLDEVHNDDRYKSVWVHYMIHGGDYTNGPKYDKELEAAKAAISRAEGK